MADYDRIEAFEAEIEALGQVLEGAREGMAEFGAEAEALRGRIAEASLQASGLNRALSGDLRRSFDDLIFDGGRLSDVMRGLAQSVSESVYSAAVRPVFSRLGGLLGQGIDGLVSGALPFASGAGFAQGRVIPFASGGIVNGPVRFPMRGGTGLMGEAGPEAIMPLSRGPDGRLGIEARGGGRPVNVVFNVSTPDVAGFERSRSQIAAQMARALGQGQRNR